MSHHSDERPLNTSIFEDLISPDLRRAKDLLRAEQLNLGATGEFPNGKYVEHDEGEIRFAVAADPSKRTVLMDFGKSIRSLGMTPEQASELGNMLIEKGLAARGIT